MYNSRDRIEGMRDRLKDVGKKRAQQAIQALSDPSAAAESQQHSPEEEALRAELAQVCLPKFGRNYCTVHAHDMHIRVYSEQQQPHPTKSTMLVHTYGTCSTHIRGSRVARSTA